MSSKQKVTIRGRTYDLADISDLTSIQSALVPENWNGRKADGVALFLSLQNMLALQLKRHLAANFKIICKTALEEGEDGGKAQVALAFGFTLDLTAPTVATIAAHKLGFSVKHETKGKPQTHDLSQGEFLDDDMNVVLNIKGFEEENAAPPEPDNIEKMPEADPAAGGDVTPENTPGDTAPAGKKKRNRKKD
jgi:hypothetical protein